MSAIQTWALSSCDLSVPASLRSSSTRRSNLSSLGFDIADNRVGGDAGEIGDVAVNGCLADDRLTAILV